MNKVTLIGLNMVLASIGLAFSGCAGMQNNAIVYHDQNLKRGDQVIYKPSLNTQNKVEVGENMFSKSYLLYDDTNSAILLEDAYVNTIATRINLKAKSQNILYKWNNMNTICATDKETNIEFCLADEGNTGAFTSYGYLFKPNDSTLKTTIKYKVVQTPPTLGTDSFKYEALYQGRAGNKIKISFREFKDDTARPAFTQDVDYELDNNGETIVGFKGLRIKVAKATNMDISYSVIHDYN